MTGGELDLIRMQSGVRPLEGAPIWKLARSAAGAGGGVCVGGSVCVSVEPCDFC